MNNVNPLKLTVEMVCTKIVYFSTIPITTNCLTISNCCNSHMTYVGDNCLTQHYSVLRVGV